MSLQQMIVKHEVEHLNGSGVALTNVTLPAKQYCQTTAVPKTFPAAVEQAWLATRNGCAVEVYL